MTRKQGGGTRSVQVGGSVRNGGVVSSGTTIIINQPTTSKPKSPPSKGYETVHYMDVVNLLKTMSEDEQKIVRAFATDKFGSALFKDRTSEELFKIKRYAQTVHKNNALKK